jgi:hypothetical protein
MSIAERLPTIRIPGTGVASAPPIAFHPHEPLVAISAFPNMWIADCTSGELLRSLPIPAEADGITFDVRGECLLAVGNNQVWIWNLNDSHSVRHEILNPAEYDLHSSFPQFSVSDSGIWSFFSNQWQLWSPNDRRIVGSLPAPHGELLLKVTHLGSGDLLAVTYDEERLNHSSFTVSVWEVASKQLLCEISLDEWHFAIVSHDAALAILHLQDNKKAAELWDVRRGIRIRDVAELCQVGHQDFCADNRHFVTEVIENKPVPWTWLCLTDLLSASQMLIDPGTPFRPAFACSAWDNVFVTIANDRRQPVDVTKFWDSVSGKEIGHTSGQVNLARYVFSPCRRWFASVSTSLGQETAVDPMPGGTVAITDIQALRHR